MIADVDRIRVTMQQMDRVLRALEDLRLTILPNNPQLFASMAEAPLDDLKRLRSEINEYVVDLAPTA
jgi:hypothetical protein